MKKLKPGGIRKHKASGMTLLLFPRRMVIFFCCALGFSPVLSVAATLHFPRGNLSLQDVVSTAAYGDTILVAPGEYQFFYDHLVIINESLVIKSSHGPQQTVLLGRGDGPVVSFKRGSKAVLDGFTITSASGSDRVTDLKGGGIYCAPESAPVIINNIITGNEAVFGGGIYCDTLSAPTIGNNSIINNSATVTGGGIFLFRSSAVIKNNRFISNKAVNSGGAIGSNRGTSRISNNIIWKNRAGFGGGISCDRSASIVTNNTIVQNTADYGGGIVVDKGSVRLANLILYQNRLGDLYFKQVGSAGHPSFSLISDGEFRGINGNFSKDPLFADVKKGDFYLQSESPCIDAGSQDSFYEDVDGSYNDMGAYGGPDVRESLDLQEVSLDN